MRRVAFLTVALAVVLTGAALAAAYRTGHYSAGKRTDVGVMLTIGAGSFSLQRISFREHCTSARGSLTDEFTFLSGTRAHLNGTINGQGQLSGRYHASDGTVTVRGQVRGSSATVIGSETTKFTQGRQTFTCHGSRTFKATRR
jgi:hypothetical protein